MREPREQGLASFRRRTRSNEELTARCPHGHRIAAPRERGSAMTALGRTVQGLQYFASDVAQGFFEITHNGFALVGLTTENHEHTQKARPDLRVAGEVRL